jgi:hypothetical protein
MNNTRLSSFSGVSSSDEYLFLCPQCPSSSSPFPSLVPGLRDHLRSEHDVEDEAEMHQILSAVEQEDAASAAEEDASGGTGSAVVSENVNFAMGPVREGSSTRIRLRE